MEEIAGNRYDYRSDIELLTKQFDSGEYKEDQAQFSKNLFIVLGKVTNGKTVMDHIDRLVENRKMTTSSHLYLQDVVRLIETEDYVNLSKYDGLLEFEKGSKQNKIKIKIRRNRETEFCNIIKKVDVSGMLAFLKSMCPIERI